MLQTKPTPRPAATRPAPAAAEHPFLIVRRADFPALRARAERWPFREQRDEALLVAEAVRYEQLDPGHLIRARATVLARVLSCCALAYILDPAGRERHVARVVENIAHFDAATPGSLMAEILADDEPRSWRHNVPTGNAYVQAVLALDVVHDELSPADVARLEAILRDGPAPYFRDRDLAWKTGTLAARAIWPLYARDEAAYAPVVAHWRADVLAGLTADGVFAGGPGYADARWSFADREFKSLFGDLLAHAGILPDWYDEPRIAAFHEWRNGYAYAPTRTIWTFGDSGPDGFNASGQPGPERAGRHSALAGGYAAWLAGGVAPPATLASYVLAPDESCAPLAAPSRVFADGGAWLKEASLDHRSLAGAMWNARTGRDAHAHKEANALAIAAYGEMPLRNAGYNGWADASDGFSWAYVHDRAIAANTVLFDYAVPQTPAEMREPSAVNDHRAVLGGGVTASLLTGVVDFARGDSGEAIPNGRHARDFLFVHPSDGAAGYFVAIDALAASTPGATGHVAWHPASARVATLAERTEYDWTIRELGRVDVGFTVFLATPPRGVALLDGALANWQYGRVATYLVADYETDARGRRDVVTVLFPHDAAHPKATFARLEVLGVSGAIVRQGEVEDVIFASDGEARVEVAPGIVACARSGLVRRNARGEILAVWLREARSFEGGGASFEASSPVTLLWWRDQLHAVAEQATSLTARWPGVASEAAGNSTAEVAVTSIPQRFSIARR